MVSRSSIPQQYHLQCLCELPYDAQLPPPLHAQERPHALQLIAGQPWQVAAPTRARAVAWHDDAAAEEDVEEGVVGGEEALCPGEEGGAVISATTPGVSSVALYDGWVDMPCLVIIILSSSSTSSSSGGRC